MERLPQPPNPDGITDETLSFMNGAMNFRNSDVGMTSVVQDPIPDKRSLLNSSFHIIREKKCMRKSLMLIYAVFLLLLLTGLGIYLARTTVCCVKFSLSSYSCNHTVIINHELQLELSWIIALEVMGFLCCYTVCKWHGAKRLKLIFRKLIKLPTFWCLIGLAGACGGIMVYSTLVLYKIQTKMTQLQMAILPLFSIHFLLMTVLVPLLNYTPIFAICRQKAYSKSIRLLVRLTLVLMFLVNLAFFFVGMLQLGFKISGGSSSGTKSHFNLRIDERVLMIMRHLTDILFEKTVMSFFWTKLFCDDKNILSHMEDLESLNESD